MQIEQNYDELILRETPGCVWLFAVFFVVIGLLFVYGSISGFIDSGSQSWLMLTVNLAIGTAGIFGGTRMIYKAPIAKVIANKTSHLVELIRYTITGRRRTHFSFDEIDQFCLVEENDGKGRPVWSLAMKLRNGEINRISTFASHDERFKQQFVLQTNEFIGKQIIEPELILESDDESGGEIV